MATNGIRALLKSESGGGIMLMIATVLAVGIANSPLLTYYQGALDVHLSILLGETGLDKPLLLWINDGLMAIFFLLVGLELKREVLQGQLSQRDQIILPMVGAAGGFVIPAAIYALINLGNGSALNGWAIPSATDIAFALGVLALLGPRVPLALKIFLTTLAIVDDLAAIIVIALFYSGDLSTLSLGLSAVAIVALFALNRLGVRSLTPYFVVGLLLWVFVLKSGVHATLAGVLLAFAIPLRPARTNDTPGLTNADGQHTGDGHGGYDEAPLLRLEHALHPWVTYAILPLFAFANAGVPLLSIDAGTAFSGVTFGIVAGLLLGKPIGVLGAVWLGTRAGWFRLPDGVDWPLMGGAAILTGIGFTMSLFIGSLAFEHGNYDYLASVRIGVLSASLVAAAGGYLYLRHLLDRTSKAGLHITPDPDREERLSSR